WARGVDVSEGVSLVHLARFLGHSEALDAIAFVRDFSRARSGGRLACWTSGGRGQRVSVPGGTGARDAPVLLASLTACVSHRRARSPFLWRFGGLSASSPAATLSSSWTRTAPDCASIRVGSPRRSTRCVAPARA